MFSRLLPNRASFQRLSFPFMLLLIGVAMFATVPCAAAAALPSVDRGITIREALIYVAPDATSTQLGFLDRGREVVVLESSKGFLHVSADVTEERTLTGWVLEKGVIRTSTPDGDKIVFGEAVDSEAEASRTHGRKGADKDCLRLYALMAEYFPQSSLAGEALYRSADIRWQLDKFDVQSRPSAKERDAYLRGEIDEEHMRQVMKKFPGTKWADKAAFHLIDNKICGDWVGASKCPEKEAALYEHYVEDRPQSPDAPEALYNAAWRRSALIEIYKTEANQKKSADARADALVLCRKITTSFPVSDFAPRATRLAYMVEHGIPTWGNTRE